jgi:hypothetical protein
VTDSNNTAWDNYNGFDNFRQTENQSRQIWDYDNMQTGENSQLALLLWRTWSAIYATCNYMIINNHPYYKQCLHQRRMLSTIISKLYLQYEQDFRKILQLNHQNGQTNVKKLVENFNIYWNRWSIMAMFKKNHIFL